ncbi:DUF6801 domain-containing protein [Streptomyces sp. NPDC056049]|uniref:DUF6801 domain-containing protein n=1 Tax=Streptomyces sp. NPDC056049 TaxID=3345693 RepID=UPI0035D54878
MSRPRPTPRPSRARVRGATIAAFVALAPLLPAAAVALETLKVDTALPYVCALPSGQQPATVRITAAFPERAAVGEEIRPTDVTTSVELPAAAVADLTALKAATVRAETRLTVGVTQNEQRAEATWSGTAQPVDVPAEGPLTLTTTGDVPILTTDTAGDLTLAAGGIAVDLAPSTADGAATVPASLAVTCVPHPDAQDRTRLATVPVGTGPGTGEPSTAPPTTGLPSPSGSSPTSPSPSSGLPLPSLPVDPIAPPPPAPTGEASGTPSAGPQADAGPADAGPADATEETPGPPAPRPDVPPCVTEKPTPVSLSAYITGYTNVRKLNGASLLPATCMLIEQGDMQIPTTPPPEGEFHFTNLSLGNLSHQGRKQTPPFTSTFLTFDFQPVTATMVLEQTGPVTIDTLVRVVFASGDNFLENTVRAPLVLRVLDVKVDGVPLDVGPSCRTAAPLSSPEPDPAKYPGDHLVLLGLGKIPFGLPAEGYVLTGGGPLTGEATIPAFTGCGSGGENFDRLLTAAISGPGNHIKQVQGQTCSVGVEVPPPDQCTEDRQPLVVPEPER